MQLASCCCVGLSVLLHGSVLCCALQVMSVELLLSALEACGVDNARIEIEGGHEIPVLDNSALGWCVEIQVRHNKGARGCCL